MDSNKKPAIRFKGFTDDWEQRKLGDIAEQMTSTVNPQDYLNDYFMEYSMPAFDEGEMAVNVLGASMNSVRKIMDKPCLLINKLNVRKKRIWHVENPEVNAVCSAEFVPISSKEVALDFIKYVLIGDRFTQYLEECSSGSSNSQKRVTPDDIISATICFPTYDEQTKIGEYFSSLDHLITLHQRKCDKLKTVKKSMLEKMFPKNGEVVPEIRFKGFTDAWEQRKLGDLTFRESKCDISTVDLPSVEYEDVIAEEGLLNKDISLKEVQKKGIVFDGSQVLYGKLRPYLHNWLNPDFTGVAVGDWWVLRPIEMNKNFIYRLIQTKQFDDIANQSAGSKMPRADWNLVSETEFMIPCSLEEQAKIGGYFSGLDTLITLHQRKLIALENIKKACLSSFFAKSESNIFKERERKRMYFKYESEFEEALIGLLSNYGWEEQVIKYPTEEDLINNWAEILFENNRGIDRLNDYPLTQGEMQQILEKIRENRTPLKLNGFINGRTVKIIRDNAEDKLHFGKEVSLKIYDRNEIAAGQSRYQIVQQPKYKSKSKLLNNRRGDLMLLINGMPVINIELKRSGVPVSEAYHQIEKYAHEGIFSGLFSLVQIFVAMTPDETVYFANPGPDGKFNKDYYFHWANFDNEPINDWKEIASSLLSIPMAHQLIGFYTVADNSDGVLKVMRSYQYYAASAISDKVTKIKWNEGNQRGGFIWHTTGSGKTMTSFKSAQLIANSQDADKVVFITDRIELGTQSLKEYRAFAEDSETVQATENTYVLVTKLKSNDPADTLIVTSIQKMSNIKTDEGGLNTHDIEAMNKKRIVFIIDEAHRSTFGDMLLTIKETFPNAVFFGFTGTPIRDENQKKMNTTTTVFGKELHRYSIADGIRDKNVLGFDPYKVLTFKDKDVRKVVALEQAKADNEQEVFADSAKTEVYNRFMKEVPMAGHKCDDGKYVKGIEDYIPNIQYRTEEHQSKVVEDIAEGWIDLSMSGKFHAIFATSSIPEAIDYYRRIKSACPSLKVTCLFDPNIDNCDGYEYKEDGLVEILEDYNRLYEQNFAIPTHAAFKKDVSLRLAHKEQYKYIEQTPEKQLDLLIVVDQMLTGFDSKWINTLYMDKLMEYENIIQAFSRTNRLFGHEKKFGTIKYYRRPHTMERNINDAVKLYAGDKPVDMFVEKLPYNLKKLNEIFVDIEELYKNAGVENFEKLPAEREVKAKFAQLFRDFNSYLDAAKIQGFKWDKSVYEFKDDKTGEKTEITVNFDENLYLILAQRYKELSEGVESGGGDGDEIPFDLVGYITEIDTGKIDANYMNSRFEKYLRILDQGNEELIEQVLNELHKSFAALTQEEQKFANVFLHGIQRGEVVAEKGKTLRDYITEYQCRAKDDQIHRFAVVLGLDEQQLRSMMGLHLTESNINEFGRLDELKKSVDKAKARTYFEKAEGTTVLPHKVNIKVDGLIRKFILSGGFDV
jgi:type I restriction enzyme R subunit